MNVICAKFTEYIMKIHKCGSAIDYRSQTGDLVGRGLAPAVLA